MKNSFFKGKQVFIIFLFAFLFSFLLVSAVTMGESDTKGVVITAPPKPTFNNGTAFVNSSIFADFWVTINGALDDVADLLPFIDFFVNESGDTMTGDLNMLNNHIKIGDSTFTNLSKNDLINGEVFGINQTGPSGVSLPHFVLQSGGGTQASYIMRSFMIVDENEDFFNGTGRTDCGLYLTSIGEELKIDCNTTTTGADLLVSDDMQVIGDVFIKDSDNEWHNMNRELDIRDELGKNTTLTGLNGTFDIITLNLTIRTLDGDNIFVNIDENNTILGGSIDSILLTDGTNSSPILNSVFYQGIQDPTLTRAATLNENVPGVATLLLGDNFVYASLIGATTGEEFIKGVYNRFLDDGAVYKSGFNITTSTGGINISNGTMKILLTNINIMENHTTSELAIEILSDGTFVQHDNNFDAFSTYATGGAIGINKYFNLVCGIVATHDFVGRMFCVPQDEPSTEHTSVSQAETDETFTNFFPGNEIIQKAYIPIVRVVIQNTPGSGNVVQTLTNGNTFIDLRGQAIGIGGSPPTVSGDDLGNHIATQNLNMSNFNITSVDNIFTDTLGDLGNSLNFWANIYSQTGNFDTIQDITGGGIFVNSQMLHFADVELWSGPTEKGHWTSSNGNFQTDGSIASGASSQITITGSTGDFVGGDLYDSNTGGTLEFRESGAGNFIWSTGNLPDGDIDMTFNTATYSGKFYFSEFVGNNFQDLFVFEDDVQLLDNEKLYIGTGTFGFPSTYDFQAHHDGTDTIMENRKGDLIINSTGLLQLGSPSSVQVNGYLNATDHIEVKKNITTGEEEMWLCGEDDNGDKNCLVIDFASQTGGPDLQGYTSGDGFSRVFFGNTVTRIISNKALSFGLPDYLFGLDTSGNDYVDWRVGCGTNIACTAVLQDNDNRQAETYPQMDNPTYRINAGIPSPADTNFIQFYHNITNGIIESGNGTVVVKGDGLYVEENLTVGLSTQPTNITLYSEDGTQFSCGVANDGTWSCS